MAGWGVSGFSGYVLCARMGNENNTRQELQGVPWEFLR